MDAEATLERNLVVRQVWGKYHQALLRFLRRRSGSAELASELAQEAFVRLCGQKDLARKIGGHERAYLFRTASNLLKDYHRRRRIRSRVEATEGEAPWSTVITRSSIAAGSSPLAERSALAVSPESAGLTPSARPPIAAGETPESILELKEEVVALKRALLSMNPKWRRVFLARRQGKSYRELAQELEVCERTVERYMVHALAYLKVELRQTRAMAGSEAGGRE